MALPRVRWRGFTFDKPTAQALQEAERLFGSRIRPTQGSYSHGAKSAGTHSGPGAIDISVRGWGRTKQDRLVKILRQIGFSAWARGRGDGFAPHIHAIRNGTPGLPRVAAGQVRSLARGRNGLASNRLDPQRYLKVKPTTWEAYLRSKKVRLPVKPAIRGGVKLVNLQAGKKNSDVKALQIALRKFIKARGYNPDKWNPTGATGLYGSQTEKLVDIANTLIARESKNPKWAANSNKRVGPAFCKRIGLRVAA